MNKSSCGNSISNDPGLYWLVYLARYVTLEYLFSGADPPLNRLLLLGFAMSACCFHVYRCRWFTECSQDRRMTKMESLTLVEAAARTDP